MPATESVKIDPESQCDKRFMQVSVGKIPNSEDTNKRVKIPIGFVLSPMALDTDENPVSVVNFGAPGIIRCKRCRTYINPFVSWLHNGRQWRCNICGYTNEVPSLYFSHLDEDGQRRDKADRPELSKGSVELVAPSEYMLRPPQAPVYVFVLDVSATAVQSGMLATAVETIKECLDRLPGQPRTLVGFITFDSAVHFFNLKSSLSQPQMLCVPDLAELFLPMPDDLLVNLNESRHVVDALLDALPTMHANNRKVDCALGPALVAAYRVMGHIGGKMCVFASNLPSVGEARLTHRENPRAYGSDKEHQQLNPSDEWYSKKAIEFSRLQICVDLFLGSAQYTDVATLSCLPKLTGGTLQYYPAFAAVRDGGKFKAELTRCLTRPTGFEAVMRVRVTRGMRISNFHGNFYMRGNDLLALPNCHPDNAFAFEILFDEAALSTNIISVQAALLYTTSSGERRIRVHTMALPVSHVVQEIVESIDMDCLCNIMARQALDVALKTGLDAGRHRLQSTCVDILRAAQTQTRGGYGAAVAYGQPPGMAGMPPGGAPQQQQQPLPEPLKLLPLFTMALQKSVVFRGGSDLRADERSYFIQRLNTMDSEQSRFFVYPRLFALHTLPDNAGLPATAGMTVETGTVGRKEPIVLPPMQPLSADGLSSDGVYMLENSIEALVWIGRAANPAVLQSLFGYSSLDQVDFQHVRLLDVGSDLATRVTRLLAALQESRQVTLQVHLIREGDPNAEARFFRHLVEDRAAFTGGAYNYHEFMSHISRQTRGLGS